MLGAAEQWEWLERPSCSAAPLLGTTHWEVELQAPSTTIALTLEQEIISDRNIGTEFFEILELFFRFLKITALELIGSRKELHSTAVT